MPPTISASRRSISSNLRMRRVGFVHGVRRISQGVGRGAREHRRFIRDAPTRSEAVASDAEIAGRPRARRPAGARAAPPRRPRAGAPAAVRERVGVAPRHEEQVASVGKSRRERRVHDRDARDARGERLQETGRERVRARGRHVGVERRQERPDVLAVPEQPHAVAEALALRDAEPADRLRTRRRGRAIRGPGRPFAAAPPLRSRSANPQRRPGARSSRRRGRGSENSGARSAPRTSAASIPRTRSVTTGAIAAECGRPGRSGAAAAAATMRSSRAQRQRDSSAAGARAAWPRSVPIRTGTPAIRPAIATSALDGSSRPWATSERAPA